MRARCIGRSSVRRDARSVWHSPTREPRSPRLASRRG
jgi:hypothetical protein